MLLQQSLNQKLKNYQFPLLAGGTAWGEQSIADGSIHLDMLRLNKVKYNLKKKTVRVEAGAQWRKVQRILDKYGRAVKVMQSDNIFTVGGSLSVNVHGWQVGSPPIASTVISLKVVTADGKIRHIDKGKDSELFRAVLGGYGQFAVITEVELKTVPNSTLKFHAKFISSEDFAKEYFHRVTQNPKAQLAYGRLSVDKGKLFEEAGVFWYEKALGKTLPGLKQESLVAIKRVIFRSSQYTDFGKRIRWSAEKLYAKTLLSSKAISRNDVMN